MGLFGGSQKTTTSIDPKTSAAQWGNYQQAQGLQANYNPTSAGLIAQYLNPYTSQVVDQSLGALDRSRQMAINGIGDQAQAAGAFGGSRHGVAEALTNGEYANQAGLLSANLYNQGFSQALGAAQDENRMVYAYPLERQGVLNQALAGITPQVSSKTKGGGSGLGSILGGAGSLFSGLGALGFGV